MVHEFYVNDLTPYTSTFVFCLIPYFCRMRKKNVVLEQVTVEDYAAEGKALARTEGKVVFISGAVPGDVVDVQLSKNKKDWAEGRAIHFHQYSKDRVEPF